MTLCHSLHLHYLFRYKVKHEIRTLFLPVYCFSDCRLGLRHCTWVQFPSSCRDLASMACQVESALRREWRAAPFLIELSHFLQRGISGTGGWMQKWGHRRSVLLTTWIWCHAASWMRGAATGLKSQRCPFSAASFPTYSEVRCLWAVWTAVSAHPSTAALFHILLWRKKVTPADF